MKAVVVVRNADLHVTLTTNPKQISNFDTMAAHLVEAIEAAAKEDNSAIGLAKHLIGLRTDKAAPLTFYWIPREPQDVDRLVYIDYEDAELGSYNRGLPKIVGLGKGSNGTSYVEWDQKELSFAEFKELTKATKKEPPAGTPDAAVVAAIREKLAATAAKSKQSKSK